MHEFPGLKSLFEAQLGLASRAQLLRLGLRYELIRARLGRSWQAVHPGVVALFTGALDAHQRLIAAQLYGGPVAHLSASTAAAWYGVETAREPSIIRLSVPANLAARRSGPVLISRTTRPDPAVWERGPLRIGSRARAVVDAAREVRSERRARAIVIEAVQRRIVPVHQIRHELESGPRNGSAKVRRAVDSAEIGAWSVPEADLLDALASSRILPPAMANPMLRSVDGERLPTPDAWLDDVALAIQVHSRAYHARDSDWETTVSGDSLFGEHGVVVLAVTPTKLAADPADVRQRVERAYLAVRDRPRPAVIATSLQAQRTAKGYPVGLRTAGPDPPNDHAAKPY
jgi:hypothetical protein